MMKARRIAQFHPAQDLLERPIEILVADSRVNIFDWRQDNVGFGMCRRQCVVFPDRDWLHDGM